MNTKRSIRELSLQRIAKGVSRRILALPHQFSWNFDPLAKQNRNALGKFKNLHKGGSCVLIANGPSLTKTDLNLFKDEITFGLNRIYLNYPNMNFRPSYLVCVNKLVLSQFHADFHREKMPKFFNWHCRSHFRGSENTYFIEKNFFASEFSKDISYSLTPAATVTYAALQIIYYMGFAKVIIVGMDHNFATSSKPNTEEVRTDQVDVNHFAPNYFPKGTKWETPDLTASNYFYSLAKEYFEKDNRRIIDCTIGGKCTVFDKGTLEDFQ